MKIRKTTQNAVSHGMNGAKERNVLVGTYKGEQLTKWRGWYNNALEVA